MGYRWDAPTAKMLAAADEDHSFSSYGGVGHWRLDWLLVSCTSRNGFGVSTSKPNETPSRLADGEGVGYGFGNGRLLWWSSRRDISC